ncbi:MAG: HNH endonuclease signature motif containing protein [Planctomycetaceae bacterium]
MIDQQTRELVRERARNRCEYCLIPQEYLPLITFPVDHIIAKQHGGDSQSNNLCLSCLKCNLQKGPNIASLDPDTGLLVPLYNPRIDKWTDHFQYAGETITGLTPVGRATIQLLGFNQEQQIELRQALITDGWPLDP